MPNHISRFRKGKRGNNQKSKEKRKKKHRFAMEVTFLLQQVQVESKTPLRELEGTRGEDQRREIPKAIDETKQTWNCKQ